MPASNACCGRVMRTGFPSTRISPLSIESIPKQNIDFNLLQENLNVLQKSKDLDSKLNYKEKLTINNEQIVEMKDSNINRAKKLLNN